MLPGEEAPKHLAAFVYGAAENNAVGTGEVDVLEDALLVWLFRRKVNGLDSRLRDTHHLPGGDFANVLRVEEIESAGFRGCEPGVEAAGRGEFAEDQRAEAAGIAYRVQFILRKHEKRIRAFDLIERVAERAGEIAGLRAGDQMDDDFGVAVGLEDGAAMLKLAAPLGGVGQVAVMAQRDLALVAIDHDRLRVQERLVAGRRI